MIDSTKIRNVNKHWKHWVYMKNLYTFGEGEIYLEEFAQLVKETFEIIKTVKNEFIYKESYFGNASDMLEYMELLTCISKYDIYDCVDDESKAKCFTATCLVAQQLCDYAVSPHGFEIIDGESRCFDSDEEMAGVFTFYRIDYPYLEEEPDNKVFRYDVYKGDFSEVIDLASQLP